MLVKEVMTKEVISVTPETSIKEVAALLIANRIHAVPVLNGASPIGIITETDFFTKGSIVIYLPEYINFIKKNGLIGKISEQQKDKMELLVNTKALDIMSQSCVTIHQDAEVSDFFALVKEQKLISVPVVDDNKQLVGIVTLSDIINLVTIK